jgi:hypothetical protein
MVIIVIHGYQVRAMQRQVDQNCQAMFMLAQEQGATEKSGFETGKEYCFFFADYSRNMALLGEFDNGISYNKKPRLIIMRNVNEKGLRYWSEQPLLYERYRKIRN